mgnify:CR=1 FL=1
MNWDYIAGFFDGEGALCKYGRRFRVSISQTNKEVLEEIRDFVSIGYVCEITKRKPHWKDAWVYFIAKQSDVYRFLIKIRPKLILKKKLAGEAIIIINTNLKEIKKEVARLEKRVVKAKQLRQKGLPYRAIGKELKIDFGYARRLIKFH